MRNVCPSCGYYRAAKIVAAAPPTVICPACLTPYPFARLPLLIVSGAAASGKSTVIQALPDRLSGVIALDSDILWGEVFASPDRWPTYFNLWLRMCKNLHQATGQPVVLAGAGFGFPPNLLRCEEAAYFAGIHILALVCDDTALAARLQQRPAWRASSDPAFVDDHIRYNRWFKEQSALADLPITLFDTTDTSLAVAVDFVAAWIQHIWPLAALNAHETASPLPSPSER